MKASEYFSILLLSCFFPSIEAFASVRRTSFLHVNTDDAAKGIPESKSMVVTDKHNSSNHTARGSGGNALSATAFQDYYNSIQGGRGIWKWNTALDAYQRHFAVYSGHQMGIAEVGVQSGGSLLLWRNVLGTQIQLYGLDINPQCMRFAEPGVDITIMDQGNWAMWQAFLQKVPTGLDVLVDDGSHLAPHMYTTVVAVFPHIRPGGYVAVEDIHGQHYAKSFFEPTAVFIAQNSHSVHSIHQYPTLLMIRKSGAGWFPKDFWEKAFTGTPTQVVDFASMWAAIDTVPGGTHIILRNKAWGSFFTAASLQNFFNGFIDMHAGGFQDNPPGCATAKGSVCTNAIAPNAHLQNKVCGMHIYPEAAIIEVCLSPPYIAAIRKGTEWIGYGF